MIVEDLSPAGFSFTSTVPIPTGACVHVGLAGAGRAAAAVAWRQGDRHGCVFRPPLTAAQAGAAFSRAGVVASFAFPSDAVAPDTATATPVPRVPPLVRLALMAAGSGFGWMALAAGLHQPG